MSKASKTIKNEKDLDKKFLYIPIKFLRLSPLNPRKHFDEKSLQDLTASIREKGILQAILVRPLKPANGNYEVICGARRFKAAQAAGLDEVPAWVRELDDKSTIEVMVIENLQREDVHPLEEAEGYEQLMKKHGYASVDDIAAKVGKSRGYVYGRMKLCDLTAENRKRFYDGKFNPSVALLVARIPANLQNDAGSYIAADKKGYLPHSEPMGYSGAKKYIEEELMVRLKEAPFDPKDATLCKKAGACTNCQKRTGNQQDLFPDVKGGDICTDPQCFSEKKKAHNQRILNQAKSEGRKIIKPDQIKSLFPYWHDDLAYAAPFIDLDKRCYEVPGSKSVTYRNVLKKVGEVKEHIHIAVTPSGAVKELIPKNKINDFLKSAGIEQKESSSSDNSYQKQQAEARKKEKIRLAVVQGIHKALSEKIIQDSEISFLSFLAAAIKRVARFDEKRIFIQRRNPEIKGDQVSKSLSEYFKDLTTAQLYDFCLELLMIRESSWGGYGETAEALCKHYGISVKDIEKSTQEDLAQKKKKNSGSKETVKKGGDDEPIDRQD